MVDDIGLEGFDLDLVKRYGIDWLLMSLVYMHIVTMSATKPNPL